MDENFHSQLFLLDLADITISQLTDDQYSYRTPRWSPVSDEIIFTKKVDDYGRIFLLKYSDMLQVQLTSTNGVNDSYPSWTNDGQWIVFNRTEPDDKNEPIWIMKTDGSEQRQIIEHGRSPDLFLKYR